VQRLGVRGEQARALGALVRSLAASSVLPVPFDGVTLIPPVLRVFVRRVPGANLWVLFTVTPAELHLRALVGSPPPLLDE
jgi:hypothetical protein